MIELFTDGFFVSADKKKERMTRVRKECLIGRHSRGPQEARTVAESSAQDEVLKKLLLVAEAVLVSVLELEAAEGGLAASLVFHCLLHVLQRYVQDLNSLVSEHFPF